MKKIRKLLLACRRAIRGMQTDGRYQFTVNEIDEALADDVLEILGEMEDEERTLLFDAISKKYCIHCGDVQPLGGCQCTNDE